MQWVIAIPHLLIASVLSNVAGALAFVSWFIIVFTGRLPDGIAGFQCLVLRYEARAYSYMLWLREPYPPFEFEMTPADPGTDPVRVDIAPQLEDRDRLTVGLRFSGSSRSSSSPPSWQSPHGSRLSWPSSQC